MGKEDEINMSIILMMIPMSIALGVGFVACFIWAAKSGQFDDVETPALRMLQDDQPTKEKK